MAMLLGPLTGLAQLNGGVSVSSGIANIKQGRRNAAELYTLAMPASVAIGHVFPAFHNDLSLLVYARTEFGVGKGAALGPGMRVYSTNGLGEQSSLKPYLDIYLTFVQFAGQREIPVQYRSSNTFASVGVSYNLFDFHTIDIFLGLIDRMDNRDFATGNRHGSYIGLGYSFIMPSDHHHNRSPRPYRPKRRKMTSCPYRYRW
ncbi:hypothetical protein BLX24_08485 [Arsenicibacter rosenii]|uniref:Outer membrane protein beta-barrel domain-containing protein n=2 Tax=Arsenicibacter rosenii TaxID=1750698 RepID=A0A1S2VQ03_9BACT|nr:hypothetical protein BLX24_08485 [Arsenicibacter rosenii]